MAQSKTMDNEMRRIESHDPDKAEDQRMEDNAAGTQADAKLSLPESLRYYKKAIIWSFIISNATIMESYDLILLKNFYAYPAFQEAYGEQLPSGKWSIPSRWQIGLAMSTNVGLVLGGTLYGWLVEKFSPRKVMICAHILVAAFVFITFFAPNVEVLLVGMLLL
jgi:SP family general alpha glucoside:H+ symporter-like MFS transporter